MATNHHQRFIEERKRDSRQMFRDRDVRKTGLNFIEAALKYKYSLNFSWLGRPIVQLPQDIIAIQELEWRVRPDLIIETGIAHGGSLVLHASLMELMGGTGHVVGIDIDIRKHNREAIEELLAIARASVAKRL